jgi:hypothetical protein
VAREIRLLSDANTRDLEQLDWLGGAGGEKYQEVASSIYGKISSFTDELEETAQYATRESYELESQIREKKRGGSDIMR